MSVRWFVIGVGGLLVLAGAALVVLHQVEVFASCATSVYGRTCTQSPAVMIAGVALVVVGLVAAVGAVVVNDEGDGGR